MNYLPRIYRPKVSGADPTNFCLAQPAFSSWCLPSGPVMANTAQRCFAAIFATVFIGTVVPLGALRAGGSDVYINLCLDPLRFSIATESIAEIHCLAYSSVLITYEVFTAQNFSTQPP